MGRWECKVCIVFYRYDKGRRRAVKGPLFNCYSLSLHCMNYGQRKAKLSVAIAAPLRQFAPAFGGQEWDKLSHPYARLWTQKDGQDAFWGIVGKQSGPLVLREGWGASPCEKGPHGCLV